VNLEFDTLADALAELERHRDGGVYRSGLCIQWHKASQEWALVDRFPK
jgi:hypothetical protein